MGLQQLTADSLVEDARRGAEVEGTTSRVHVAALPQVGQVLDFVSVSRRGKREKQLVRSRVELRASGTWTYL